jgi:hypothetical protein
VKLQTSGGNDNTNNAVSQVSSTTQATNGVTSTTPTIVTAQTTQPQQQQQQITLQGGNQQYTVIPASALGQSFGQVRISLFLFYVEYIQEWRTIINMNIFYYYSSKTFKIFLDWEMFN